MTMSTAARTARWATLSALLVAIAAGCAAPAAPVASTPSPTASVAPTPTTSPTPTPSPAVPAAMVIVAARGVIVVDAANTTLVEVPFSTAPSVAIDQLSDALGENPTALIEPADSCLDETTITRWGGLRLDTPPSFAAIAGAQFTAGSDGPLTAGGVPIVAGPGFAVGEPVSAATRVASVRTIDNGSFVSIVAEWNGASYDDPEAWGIRGFATGGVIQQFGAPVYFYYDC